MLIQPIFKSQQSATVDSSSPGRAAERTRASADLSVLGENDICTIGDISRIYGVSLRALRFYEERQLLQPERRGASRLYDKTSRQRLELILKGKQLGFTLTEIRDMLERGADAAQAGGLTLAPSQVHDQLIMLERQRAEIDRAIEELRATKMRLEQADQVSAQHSPPAMRLA